MNRVTANHDSRFELVGESPALQAVVRSARLVAATDATVLILGESGTGKELLARLVHQSSRRAQGPWITLNCAALPEELVESELFGYQRGAFTGAQADTPGRVQQAHGGTLFLDEVAELPPAAQAKLLRFLEYGECQALGAGLVERVDVRILAATHQDLRTRVADGTFREDLFYRLHVIPLELPPLRERDGDLPLLARRFCEELAGRHGVEPPALANGLLRRLADHGWPGNVRELRNLIERCVVLMHGRSIDAEDLPNDWLQAAAPRQGDAPWQLPAGGVSLEALEGQLIRQALEQAQGNRSRAARLLGLTRDTLLYRMKKHAIA
ncbi:sigma 54-interacting transcriptional regulator [Halomonas campisalis]|uniref:Sigma 54-interacting transcriptional regulator n=1 Tax=Billgrantia campisalis TaxID=74661 RepID=A0ABS9P4X3_9GAMM|nr:sigma 54-interacting transcriptional regulator [Halomonas campisalis]MCG6656837.1 sigma 54-interacting transcriptional regulator [Halomonas campisalis]MDR5862026.1 sigma 54-interacting transcriptional regulator [Halomonas campisalis]